MRVLQTSEISKSYRGRRVVDGVSVSVSQGEVVGLLGPNGSVFSRHDLKNMVKLESAVTEMNRLTTALEHDSVRRTRDLRLIQTGAFALAMVNFLLIVFGMLRRHRSMEEDSRRWQAMARHDPLTGIANRKAFDEAVGAQLSRARIDAQPGALLMLDLDGFKGVNDRFGHAAGDTILRAVASRLEAAARATDIVARLGGDEFGVILPELANGDNLLTHTARLADAIRQPFHFENMPLSLEASIGHAICPDDGTDIDVLIDRADQAMYERKRARHR